jgi:hypothetical protein
MGAYRRAAWCKSFFFISSHAAPREQPDPPRSQSRAPPSIVQIDVEGQQLCRRQRVDEGDPTDPGKLRSLFVGNAAPCARERFPLAASARMDLPG